MTAHVAWSTIFFAVQKAYGMLWRNATMSQSHKTRPSPWRTWMVTSLSWAQNWSIPQKTGRRYRHGWLKRLKCSNPVLNPKKNCVIPFSLPDRDCRCCGALGWPCHGWLWEESWKKRTIKAEGNGLPMFSIFFLPKSYYMQFWQYFRVYPCPLPETCSERSTSDGGAIADMQLNELCLAKDRDPLGQRQVAGGHSRAMENGVPQI